MLLYDCDYSIVVNDAENILRVYESEGRIDVTKTYIHFNRYDSYKFETPMDTGTGSIIKE